MYSFLCKKKNSTNTERRTLNVKLLVIGGCGFLGSNLASFGIKEGYDVTVFDNLSK